MGSVRSFNRQCRFREGEVDLNKEASVGRARNSEGRRREQDGRGKVRMKIHCMSLLSIETDHSTVLEVV